MKHFLLLALAATLLPAPAAAQMFGGERERTYTVTDYNRVRLDGGFAVELVTGTSPFARAKGSAAALDRLTVEVQGRTLVIRQRGSRTNYNGEDPGPVTIEIGTHDLERALVAGAGSLTIDRVRGLEFDAAVLGSGFIRIDRLETDRFDLLLNGAASGQVSGDVEEANIIVRGLSGLRAADLDVDDLTMQLEGPGIAELGTIREVELDASGAGQVSLGGRPACTLRINGSAVVRGCSR